MPQSRLFDGNNNQLTTASSYARSAIWTAACWVRIAEAVGSDGTINYLIETRRATSPYGMTGLRLVKINGRWVPGSIHDMSGSDAYTNGVTMPLAVFGDWVFVAGSHTTDSVAPRLWVGGLDTPIVEATAVAGQYYSGTGSTDTNAGPWQIGGYSTANILKGLVSWAAWWGASLTPGEIDTYRQQTAAGSWPNVRRDQLWGLWPLTEPSGASNARDLSSNARTLTATSMSSGDIGPSVDPPASDWWWRNVALLRGGSPQTISPTGIGSAETFGTAVVTTDTGRTLNGSTDGFSGTGIALTGSWSWAGHVNLDAAGGYLWRTDASGTLRQSVSIETVDSKVRLCAYQARATTASQATWEIPLPLGTELAVAVVYDSSSGKFRAWAGTADIPATELQWRYSQTVGSGAQSGSGTTWSISPASGRVDGMVAWVAVTDDVLALAEIDLLRRYGPPPQDANLQGWWKLAETVGDAADSSGNGRTLIAAGTPGLTARAVTAPAESAQTLTLTSVSDYQLFQRDGTDKASVSLTGAYGGSPLSIQARFVPFSQSPGSWTTVVASPSGGTYSGSLTVSVGQGILEVRANHTGTYAYVRRYAVAVGDLFFVVGTSNASGVEKSSYARVETFASDYKFGGRVPAMLWNWNTGGSGTGHQWVELHDPTDAYSSASTDLAARTSSIFGPNDTWTQYASDGTTDGNSTGAGKSWVAYLAARCLAETSVPVAFAPLPRGGSNAPSWMRAAGQYWNELRSRCEQVSGQTWSVGNPLTGGYAAAVLAVIGENDYASDPTNYEAAASNSYSIRHWGKTDVYGELGLPVHLMVVGDWTGTSAYAQASNPNDGITRVRKANQSAWVETGILPGPNTYEIDLADGGGDTYHYRTDAEISAVADRWWAVLAETYYGAPVGAGRGPRVQSATRSGLVVTIKFDTDLDSAGSGYNGLQVYDGTPAAGTRLTWVASSPSSGQYTAVRDGTDKSKVLVTLGSSPSGTVYVGCGEWDLSGGKDVPAATRTVGSVSVTLPAEVFSQVPATSTQNLLISGIASSESHGTPAITPGSVTISPTGIASAEAHGNVTVTPGVVTVSPAGIGSGEGWGTPAVTAGQIVAPTSIASGEAVGSPAVTPGVVTVSPTGIGSAEGWGSPVVSAGQTVTPTSIASSEAVGSPALTTGPVTASPTGIGSAEAWGTPTIAAGQIISPSSIASGESWGTATVTVGAVTVIPAGIPSGEIWGTPGVAAGKIVTPTSIASTEQWGSPAVTITGTQTLSPTSIASREAWGLLAVVGGASVYRDIDLSDRQRRPRSKWRRSR